MNFRGLIILILLITAITKENNLSLFLRFCKTGQGCSEPSVCAGGFFIENFPRTRMFEAAETRGFGGFFMSYFLLSAIVPRQGRSASTEHPKRLFIAVLG